MPSPGFHVACWMGVVAIESPVTPSWYQRTPATLGDPPLPTTCVNHTDSTPPIFE